MAEPAPQDKEVFRVELEAGEQRLRLEVPMPVSSVRLADILPVFQRICDITVTIGAAQALEDGRPVSCRAGCGACCRQLVPVSQSEARRLAEMVAGWPPERREAVERRFREGLAAFEEAGLGSRLRTIHQDSDPDAKRDFGLRYFRQGVPCPFLEDESCSIHPDRPLSCREYLVTSPAERCVDPGPGRIQFVALPTHPSRILYRFEDGEGRAPVRWVPLLRVLEWHDEFGGTPAPQFRASDLLRRFLAELQRSMRSPGGQTPGGQTPGGQTPGGQTPGGQPPDGPPAGGPSPDGPPADG